MRSPTSARRAATAAAQRAACMARTAVACAGLRHSPPNASPQHSPSRHGCSGTSWSHRGQLPPMPHQCALPSPASHGRERTRHQLHVCAAPQWWRSLHAEDLCRGAAHVGHGTCNQGACSRISRKRAATMAGLTSDRRSGMPLPSGREKQRDQPPLLLVLVLLLVRSVGSLQPPLHASASHAPHAMRPHPSHAHALDVSTTGVTVEQAVHCMGQPPVTCSGGRRARHCLRRTFPGQRRAA